VQLTSGGVLTRPASVSDAPLVHALYHGTPKYFDIISIPVPTIAEVETDLETAIRDHRRHVELIFATPDLFLPGWEIEDFRTGRQVVGYLDYKLDYPEAGDATVNLLLIHSAVQSNGIGRRCVEDLEDRLRSLGEVKRVLASIFGQNTRAQRFWERLGYEFAIDAKPVLDWYAKELRPGGEGLSRSVAPEHSLT